MSFVKKRNIFLHFLDYYHYKIAIKDMLYDENLVAQEMREGLRLCLLFGNICFVPVSAYYENKFTKSIVNEHSIFSEAGYLYLSGGDQSLYEHLEQKRDLHFDKNSEIELYKAYRKFDNVPILYQQAMVKTHEDMTTDWLDLLNNSKIFKALDPNNRISFDSNFEETWNRIPEVLERKAIVSFHIVQAFRQLGTVPVSELTFLRVLDPSFTMTYCNPLKAGVLIDMSFCQTPWKIETPYVDLSFRSIKNRLKTLGIDKNIFKCSSDLLLTLRLSNVISDLESYVLYKENINPEELAAKVMEILHPDNKKSSKKMKETFCLGVVTALPEEWLAVKTALDAEEINSPKNDPNRYAKVLLKTGNDKSDISVVITFLPRMGTNSASTATTNMLRSFPEIEDVIFSGIACGCPNHKEIDKHVRLGDIVVSDKNGLVQLDMQAIKEQSIENRSSMPVPSRKLLNAVRLLQADELEGEKTWNKYIDEIIEKNSIFSRPDYKSDILLVGEGMQAKHPKDNTRIKNYPKIFHGVIGSSNSLLRNRTERDLFRDKYNLRAIEMEGAGTAESVWQFGKDYLIVRGVCDYGDTLKNDKWHSYAACVAAAYTKSLLNRLN